MNPILLLIRLFLSVKSFQTQVNEEAEDFDQEHDIRSPGAKRMAWLLMAGKVILVMSIMGEFPLDLLPGVVTLAEKLGWLGVLGVMATVLAGLLIFISESEKEDQRVEIHSDQAIARQKQESQTRRQYRQRRKNSPFLPDH